jgi:hypothetical protein
MSAESLKPAYQKKIVQNDSGKTIFLIFAAMIIPENRRQYLYYTDEIQ